MPSQEKQEMSGKGNSQEDTEGSKFSSWLKHNLKNNTFAIFFGSAIGLPIVLILYYIGGSDIFANKGGTIDPRDVAIFLPVNLIFIVGMNYFAGWLKREKGWKTNYTRKITHISNFTFLMVLTFFGGYTASLIFGAFMIVYGITIIVIGDGNIFYEAVARESDSPYRAFYLIIPTVATMIAILMNRTFFGDYANLGYLVAGWGDAAGEPIGVRFGKHKYKVPTLTGIPCTRSIEGSTAVFLVGSFAAVFSLITLLEVAWSMALLAGIIAGFGATLVEAISFHGVDNFTIQIAAVSLAYVVIEVPFPF